MKARTTLTAITTTLSKVNDKIWERVDNIAHVINEGPTQKSPVINDRPTEKQAPAKIRTAPTLTTIVAVSLLVIMLAYGITGSGYAEPRADTGNQTTAKYEKHAMPTATNPTQDWLPRLTALEAAAQTRVAQTPTPIPTRKPSATPAPTRQPTATPNYHDITPAPLPSWVPAQPPQMAAFPLTWNAVCKSLDERQHMYHRYPWDRGRICKDGCVGRAMMRDYGLSRQRLLETMLACHELFPDRYLAWLNTTP